jgi:hypothetical protein
MKAFIKKIHYWLWIMMTLSVSPILLFLVGWWGSVAFVPESRIWIFALSGFIFGILLSFLLFKKVIQNLFSIPYTILVFIYIFYFIGIYGFFMGFVPPVVLLSISAGSYLGERVRTCTEIEKQRILNRAMIFTLLCLFIGCFTTAYLALREKTIGLQVQHMLGLPFPVTHFMVWVLIIVGSFLLFIVHYFLMIYWFKKFSS